MQDMVSIVVPIYNQELYLDRSLNSLINQSYHCIEIICVNDGSTDRSLELVKKYALNDNRIKVVSEENGGLVQATITGIKKANGKYICFCDPDDYVGKDFISTFICNIKDADFIAYGFYHDREGDITPYPLDKDNYFSGESLNVIRSNFILDPHKIAVSNEIYVSRWNKMYRLACIKDMVEEYGRCLDVSLGEDSIFTYLMLRHCKSGIARKTPNTYFYNTHSQTSMMSNTETSKHVYKAKTAYQHLQEFEVYYGNERDSQSLALYFFLIESIFQRTKNQNVEEFLSLFQYLKSDPIYLKSLKYIISKSKGKEKLKIILREKINQPKYYLKLSNLLSRI